MLPICLYPEVSLHIISAYSQQVEILPVMIVIINDRPVLNLWAFNTPKEVLCHYMWTNFMHHHSEVISTCCVCVGVFVIFRRPNLLTFIRSYSSKGMGMRTRSGIPRRLELEKIEY